MSVRLFVGPRYYSQRAVFASPLGAFSLHSALGLAAQCIVIGPVCGGRRRVFVFVGLLPRQLEIACIDPHQTGFAGKGSDHLQLIKFWPSRAPGKGVCDGAKIFGSTLLQPARSVCISLSAFFHYGMSCLSWRLDLIGCSTVQFYRVEATLSLKGFVQLHLLAATTFALEYFQTRSIIC